MLLAIDVGNTNTVIGLFEGEKLARSWRLTTVAGTDSRRVRHSFQEPVHAGGIPG